MNRRSGVVVAVAAVALVAATATAGAVTGGRARQGSAAAGPVPSATGAPSGATPSGPPPSAAEPPPAPAPPPTFGPATQASLGDPLFPGLGNGGYDVQAYDLRVTYPAKDPTQTITLAVTVRARATERLAAFDLDYSGPGLGTVTVDGKPAAAQQQG